MSREQQPAAEVTNKQAILAIILVSYVMIVLDISVVLTELPRIQRDLGFSAPDLARVQSAYTLTFGGFLLLGARVGDILGRRRMFVAGMALFTPASFAIGVSSSAPWILAWRAIQGIGAAILAPSTLALLQTNFAEGPERTRAISLYSAAAGISATIGLVLGGILADWLSWRALAADLERDSLPADAARLLQDSYRARLQRPDAELRDTIGLSALRRKALAAERECLSGLLPREHIGDEAFHELQEALDWAEADGN